MLALCSSQPTNLTSLSLSLSLSLISITYSHSSTFRLNFFYPAALFSHLHAPRMKKMNTILKKCKSLSRMGRSLSYSSLRSKSTREANELWSGSGGGGGGEQEHPVVVFVGSSRRPYLLSPKYLHHPVLSALVEKSEPGSGGGAGVSVRCEVVLFDHLLWMLDNADLEEAAEDSMELASLYAC